MLAGRVVLLSYTKQRQPIEAGKCDEEMAAIVGYFFFDWHRMKLLLFQLRRAASAAALHTKPLADTSPGKRWETHAGIKDEVTIIPAS